ncbi:MAG: Threonine dehydratase (EC [uncultured Sulfurovum sp.]|uniref:Threonine dehydratase (EC) n=1 Tax=uncultured Sulfurovum sp. TaxID=269237 RepID=A0A6S6U157_9BACT|nr:MAG: Threonine dehydratase (EC [uncultured Sulfurovum sp.]
MLDLKSIKEAEERLNGVAHHTPFSYAPILSEMSGYEVYLKKENLQQTGAFKLRGAFNKIATLIEEGKKGGVVAASAGNHAQGVAFSASHFGIEATIVMPDSTPMNKIQGVERFGAKVILKGSNYDEAYVYATKYSNEHQLAFVHPFTDDEVMSGQGTVAIEMLAEQKGLDAIVVPVGGGGLIAGMGVATKALSSSTKVIGIAANGAPAMKQSYDSKDAFCSLSVKTIADGIAVRDASPITLAHILHTVDAFELVCEDEIAAAILFLLEKQKVLVEGAGAVGVAALMHDKINLPKGSKVGVVLSGGNIDVTMLSLIIEKGLVKSSRKMKLAVVMVDKPGSLMHFTELLSKAEANIVHIGYDRTSVDLAFGDATVSVFLETKGATHQEEVRKLLRDNEFTFEEIN